MPTARGWLSTCTVDNYIYAIGGALDIGSNLDALEAFDPVTNTWTTKTPMPTPRGCAAACAVDGIIYVFGGGWYTVHSTVEAYDPSNDTWTTKSPMPTARSGLSVCVVDGIIYAISGFDDMNNPLSTNTVEAYDPKTDTWTIKAPIPTCRAYFGTSVVDGIIYAFGGFNSAGAPSLGNVEAYDPVLDVWTIKNDMPNPRAGMASYAFGGNIYCIGGVGYGGGPCCSTICKYVPASDTWEEFSDMPYAAFSISSSLLNGYLYLIGGLNDARTPLDIVYEITPSLVLPVELVSFTGNNIGGNVLLEWKTATELNNNGFEVQRKFAESGFSTIGFVKGEGTTTKQKEYSYTDKILTYGKYFYRLKQIDYDGRYEYSNVIEVDVRSLDKFALEQNYPNPFNPTTTIKYEIPDQARNDNSLVTLKIYDALGCEVATLVNEEKPAGTYEVTWDASGHSSGVYYYQLSAGNYVETKKMVLLR
jgi:N-acetylneuraminic acid mutarotase